jgi:hypothetical protein
MTNTKHTAGPVIRTVPALAGLVFAAASAVQFLDAQIALGVLDWSFKPALALVVSLGSLLVAFASSNTRDWEHLENAEQATVAVALLIMLTHQYTPTVETAIANNQPWAGFVAFMSGMIAWGVLAR